MSRWTSSRSTNREITRGFAVVDLGQRSTRVSWLKKMHKAEVWLSLPKFRSESRFQLKQPLVDLGMPLAFQDGVADFTGMNEGASLCIAKVIHQSFVEVNEEGTEAAAATAVVMHAVSERQQYQFLADHSFVYLIRDTKTGNILFLGRYTGP